jgi:spore coat protein U-like protein
MTLTPAAGGTTWNGTIYGTIPVGANASFGNYTDSIQASIILGGGTNDQNNFTVMANVQPECTVSTSAVNFGGYDPVSANAATPKDSTGTVNVYCTVSTTATVTLDLGTNASGTTRRMLGSTGDFLAYELYRDAGRTVIWNTVNTNSGTSTSLITPINGGFTAYGRIFSGQDVGVGSYSSTVTVTVNY